VLAHQLVVSLADRGAPLKFVTPKEGGILQFTTMAVAQEPQVKQLLGVPDQYAVAAVVPLGRPVKQPTRLRRQPVEEFVTWQRYDGAPFTA